MSWTYWCPHCGGGLNPGETVILRGECDDTRTLVGLDPRPGEYRAYLPPAVEVRPGSRWHFSCPVCAKDLETSAVPGLCALDGVLEGRRHRVYFSPVAGEQATFVVSAEGIVESYGKHAGRHSLDLLQLT